MHAAMWQLLHTQMYHLAQLTIAIPICVSQLCPDRIVLHVLHVVVNVDHVERLCRIVVVGWFVFRLMLGCVCGLVGFQANAGWFLWVGWFIS
jgi:hypothetical protein